jgi:hypothetical protein
MVTPTQIPWLDLRLDILELEIRRSLASAEESSQAGGSV